MFISPEAALPRKGTKSRDRTANRYECCQVTEKLVPELRAETDALV